MITQDIQAAADILRSGGLVAFPTETVYGLGANALDPAAVAKVFAFKGRPSNNPLIVHVSGVEMAKQLVEEWPEHAESLAREFWPGPLTLVLPKSEAVPNIATGGGDSVAIRMPSHPVALELIDTAGMPIVGPSANISGSVSPTAAVHVESEFDGELMVLDGGPCTTGIESTVVRVTDDGVEILRPGVVGAEDLEKLVQVRAAGKTVEPGAPLPSPGLLTKHYAPKATTRLVDDCPKEPESGKVVVLALSGSFERYEVIRMPSDAGDYAARLYAALREADAMQPDLILIERPDAIGPIWDAVRDRIRRASASD